jgi:hypothetical protein
MVYVVVVGWWVGVCVWVVCMMRVDKRSRSSSTATVSKRRGDGESQ